MPSTKITPEDLSPRVVKQIELDFGSLPIEEQIFIVSDSDVFGTSQIIGSIAYEAPTGKDLDELEMDSFDLKFAPGPASITIYLKGLEGYVADKFRINYMVG